MVIKHQLLNSFYEHWQGLFQDGTLPGLSNFSAEILAGFDECGLVFKHIEGEVLLTYSGKRNSAVLARDLLERPITDLYSPALKSLQMGLLMPCFLHGVGVLRMSRLWYGHRHKDVEWLLLPTIDEATGHIALVGLAATFVEPNERDAIVVGSPMVERLMRQDYISLQRSVELSTIDSHGWAVLDTMGAKICIDGVKVEHDRRGGIAGEAGLVASKVSHANVLAVVSPAELGPILARLGARYNLKVVETLGEAKEILRRDMIDVLVTTETVNDVQGLELVKEAQDLSAFTACVMMLDPRDDIEDMRLVHENQFVECLVKPVGEFALRKAVDEANSHALKHRYPEGSEH